MIVDTKAHWSAITKALRTVYTAPTVDAAEARFGEFEADWGERYPAIIRLWRSSWEQFTPFLAFPPEIRKVIYTTDEIVNHMLGPVGSFVPISLASVAAA